MKRLAVLLGIAAPILAATFCAWGVTPNADEMATARQWSRVVFEGLPPVAPDPGVEVTSNHDFVQKNARFNKPLKIGGVDYVRGLFCHAQSKLVVRLPKPGATFSAVVGVDDNSDTSNGKGSIVFSVSVGGEVRFKSEVMHGGSAGIPIAIDLAGAKEFVIEINDAGDGISADQGDWADAKVTFADGGETWLADLPMLQTTVAIDPAPPFSFIYGGKPSSELLPTWKTERSSKQLDDSRVQHVITYSDPETGLTIRCEAIEYRDYPTVEWTLYFKNAGASDTPILEKIQALEVGMNRGERGSYILHHNVGSPADGTDYGPIDTTLAAGSKTHIGGARGRATNTDMSYFNIESAPNGGLIAVVGWPGQWAADFMCDEGQKLHLNAGLELTHFKLLPGEELRSPLIVLQFWSGEWIRSQNIWRHWMMAHSMPKPGGQLPAPMTEGCSSRAYEEMIKANTETQIMFIDRYLEEKIKIDYWWMDAGWYIQETGWPQVGTWEVDPKRFPDGFKPISEHAHKNGVKILVWFEPERVAGGTWLTKNHPEWIFGGVNGGLLNLGNDEARQWLTDHVDALLTEQGIDLYRQDFNMDPLNAWRANDAEDRQGVTEIKHVTGYLAYWDELIRRHPNMLIDSCASGGRRNDLETMRRAVPLWRSDYAFEPNGHQGMTYGVSLWLPFHGTGTVACIDAPYYGGGKTPVQPYAFWSNAAPSINCGVDLRVKDIDYDALRELFEQWRALSPNYYGDYYPLTKYSLDKENWIGWQFDRPNEGKGMIQIFRRAASIYTAASFKLMGLDPAAKYQFEDVTTHEQRTFSGEELLNKGLPASITDCPGFLVLSYSKLAS